MRHLTWIFPGFGLLLGCSAPGPNAEDASALSREGDFAVASADSWQCSSRVELSSLWSEVRKRHDQNGDGQVTASEYTRGETRFSNYDRNGDGLLDASDFPEDTHFNGFNHMILRFADGDENDEVTLAEWQEFQASLDGNGDFDKTDLATTFRDQDYNGDGVLAGAEMSGWQTTMKSGEGEPPQVGELAPIFSLPYADDPSKIFQSDAARQDRPLVLVFGSYT